MSSKIKEVSKYYVSNANHSAIGDHAKVMNYFAQPSGHPEPGLAALGALFERVNARLEALEEADRAMLKPAVQQTAAAAAAIQKGDDSPDKQSFLEKRLKALYGMSNEIGEVIITTLASPAAGIALTLQKIAQKAQSEINIGQKSAG